MLLYLVSCIFNSDEFALNEAGYTRQRVFNCKGVFKTRQALNKSRLQICEIWFLYLKIIITSSPNFTRHASDFLLRLRVGTYW